MKYLLKFKSCLFIAVLLMSLSSCEDFLNRPDPGAYTLSDFYNNDEQLLQAANILYNSPWHDFSRGFIGVGDGQSGNHYSGGGGWWMLNHKEAGIQEALEGMAAALWSANARANTTLENINMYAGPGTTEVGRNTAKGEILVWKAMAYFYSVRIYGAVPIVHDNSAMMASGEYNTLFRTRIDKVYDYIVMTLEQAIKWLPEQNRPGRIDRYSAYGLLAKVYLTKSGYGQSGSRNQADLDKAKEYAAKVVNESGRELELEYSDIFRGRNNFTREALISWHWIALDNWTCANMQQSDLAPKSFCEHNCWGEYNGPSIDLQNVFGEDALKLNTRNNNDKRRKATMMMYGDVYDYFWRDKPTKPKAGSDTETVTFSNGFDVTMFFRDVCGQFFCPTGANAVKHLAGNDADHTAEMGIPMPGQMATGLSTHILRLADVYLIYAEAILGNSASTTDPEALKVFNAVRKRAGVPEKTAITFDDIFLERRLELAYEGDFWYDFVRLAYYNPDDALDRLNRQERRSYSGLISYTGFVGYLDKGEEGVTMGTDGLPTPRINEDQNTGQPFLSTSIFEVPFPQTDLSMNPNLLKEPQDFDLSTLSYE